VTIFIDATNGASLRPYLIEMGFDVVLHSERFGQGTDDVDWIPVAARENRIALTRDKHIKTNKIERMAVIQGPWKYYVLRSAHSDVQTHASVIRKHLLSIKALWQHMPAPYIATMTLQDLRFEWLGNPNLFDATTEPTAAPIR
jgi:predicted nuclease of predicted toxin-antitoxin system